MFRSAHVLTAAVIALSACHHTPAAAADDVSNPSFQGRIYVQVINRNVLDVEIYVRHGGQQNRVGLATAATTTEFRIPISQLGAGSEYQLIGDPIGARINVYTEIMHARPNDVVVWSLEDSFSRSTVTVH
ncbi:MAG TPA: hypothetical protein VNC11_12460 [Gemmatimonadaceae bacterium]|jgi:hypothetical protein|nr:hypothetical protein [Gemmatimonadaceae bacterium]